MFFGSNVVTGGLRGGGGGTCPLEISKNILLPHSLNFLWLRTFFLIKNGIVINALGRFGTL